MIDIKQQIIELIERKAIASCDDRVTVCVLYDNQDVDDIEIDGWQCAWQELDIDDNGKQFIYFDFERA